jgi:Protein of unknown function (DUF3429)
MPETKSDTTIPTPALILGAAGLLPFIVTALQVSFGWPFSPRLTGPALYNLTIYGAVILSFLGGVQWGFVAAKPAQHRLAAWRRYLFSVLPSLAAWAGLWFAARNGLLILAASFVLAMLYDLWTSGAGEAPRWYGRLRIGLTAVVVVCLLAAIQLGPF